MVIIIIIIVIVIIIINIIIIIIIIIIIKLCTLYLSSHSLQLILDISPIDRLNLLSAVDHWLINRLRSEQCQIMFPAMVCL